MAYSVFQSVFWFLLASAVVFFVIFRFFLYLKKKTEKRDEKTKRERRREKKWDTNPVHTKESSFVDTAAKLAKRFPQEQRGNISSPFDEALTAEINRVKNVTPYQISSSDLQQNNRKRYFAVAMAVTVFSLVLFFTLSTFSLLNTNKNELSQQVVIGKGAVNNPVSLPEPSIIKKQIVQEQKQVVSRNNKIGSDFSQDLIIVKVDPLLEKLGEKSEARIEAGRVEDYAIKPSNSGLLPTSNKVISETYLVKNPSASALGTSETLVNRNTSSQASRASKTQEELLGLELEQQQTALQKLERANAQKQLELAKAKEELIQTRINKKKLLAQARITMQELQQDQAETKQFLTQAREKQVKAQAQLELAEKQTIIQKLIRVSTDFAQHHLHLKKKEVEINAMDELFTTTKSYHYKKQKALLEARKTQLNNKMLALSQEYLLQLRSLCGYSQSQTLELPNLESPIERIASQFLKQQLTTCPQYKTMSVFQVVKMLRNNYKELSLTR